MAIREQRYITIRNKIITRADVQKLAKVMYSLYKRKKRNYGLSFRFSASCDDGSSFSSQQMDIFDDDSPITSKKVESITMYYHDVDSGELVEIKISHTFLDNKYYNSITVEGNDSNWVNGTIKRFEEIADSFTPQNTLFTKHGQLIGTVILVVGVVFINKLVDRLIPALFPSFQMFGVDSLRFESFIIQFLAYMVIGSIWYIPFGRMWWKLLEMYPSVELQIAPDHKLVEKRRRVWLTNIVVLILIPILLQVVFEIIARLI